MDKMQVLAGYCHDISTPLANACGFLKLIETNQWQDDERCRYYLELTQHNLNQISFLLRELSKITFTEQKADQGLPAHDRLQLSSVDLLSFLQHKLAAIEPVFQEQQRSLELICTSPKENNQSASNLPLLLSVDIGKLERCLDNLLTNALKYGYDNTPVQIVIACSSNILTIEIINQGPTIGAADLNKLTQPGFRLSNLQAKSELGLQQGLGLALVKELMVLQGGCLHIKSADEITHCRLIIPI